MSISDLTPVAVFLGTGTRGPFPFTDDSVGIPYGAAAHIVVERVSAAGAREVLADGVDYDLVSVAQEEATGLYTAEVLLRGSVDALAAASGSDPAERLVVYRSAPIDQSWALEFNQRFPSQSFTRLQNKVALALQDLRARIDRAVLMPAGDDAVTLADRLLRKGKVLGGHPTTGLMALLTLAETLDADGEVILQEFEFEAIAAQTDFRLTNVNFTEPALVLVWVGGAIQPATAYSLAIDGDDTILTMAAPGAGVDVQVRLLGSQAATDVGVSLAMAPVVQAPTLGASDALYTKTFIATDATPSVSGGRHFVTAGATPITTFDDGVNGQVIHVHRGSADIVLTDSATITPLAAGDITLTATRPSVSFRNDAGVWKEITQTPGFPTAFLQALAALAVNASLVDVIEALEIDDYGDARWASLTDNNVLEGTQTAPQFTASASGADATLRAVRGSGGDARMRGMSASVEFGSYSNHPVNLMVNGVQRGSLDASGNLVAEGGVTGTGVTASATGADAAVRAVRASGADARMRGMSATVEFGSYSAHPVLLMYNGAEKARLNSAGDVDFAAGAGTAIGLRAPTANGEAARWQDVCWNLQFGTGENSILQATTNYIGQASSNTASDVVGFRATRACKINKMYASVDGSPGDPDTFTYTVRVADADTTVTCQTPGGARTSEDTAHSVSVTAGQRIEVKLVTSLTAAARKHRIMLELGPA